jgi:transposase
MAATEFLSTWKTRYSHLGMSAREVAKAFDMTSSKAAAMLQSFVASGECTARYYTASRVTIYTLCK